MVVLLFFPVAFVKYKIDEDGTMTESRRCRRLLATGRRRQ